MLIFRKTLNKKFAEQEEKFLKQFIENQMLSLRNFVIPNDNKPIKNHFLLFNYESHIFRVNQTNLGDYVQTLAVKNALTTLFPNATFQTHDRDSLTSFCAGGGLTPVIMQGWFAHSNHFIPNNQTLPIFVGTHFTSEIHKFLEYFIAYYPFYFKNKEIGCRDLWTLQFCQNKGLKAYFSRCLTLTLPRREANVEANKVFLVGISEKDLRYIPQNLSKNAIQINQQYVETKHQNLNFESQTQNLLETYKKEAKLVITCALHCAAPCVAMGIPVVLIAKNEENKQRFSAVSGILRIWTLEELKAGLIDFNPKSLEIESLKKDMLENLRLSIQKEMGEKIEEQQLLQIRMRIAEFKAKNFDESSSGGGA
ncbi:polysaccharide pyruvyl transferase family protein [Helicobacter turcicus]|uniref:Polysaccharide pyruvyl transferase family protein n=1 Tax=Helicobacter turcicus TaxID=2867412 RepID=A0ABS7JPY0_9HELI|nr:polysaccharide pyruvyl transferase family protein [Helicobacter turcicus]MBX7491452.1 polysaccharide pyruvyl transferase family protein [Helicobacter turcicus]